MRSRKIMEAVLNVRFTLGDHNRRIGKSASKCHYIMLHSTPLFELKFKHIMTNFTPMSV